MTLVEPLWELWLFSHPLSHPALVAKWPSQRYYCLLTPAQASFISWDTLSTVYFVHIRSIEKRGMLGGTLLQWKHDCRNDAMKVVKLILFNQGVGEGRHHKWAQWWLLNQSLMYPLPSVHTRFFRLCALKKRECAIPTGSYQKRCTHIGT